MKLAKSATERSPERSVSALLKNVSRCAVEPRKVTNSVLLRTPSELASASACHSAGVFRDTLHHLMSSSLAENSLRFRVPDLSLSDFINPTGPCFGER